MLSYFDKMVIEDNQKEIYLQRIANYLLTHFSGTIHNAEFYEACSACHVNPDIFDESDIDRLQEMVG